MFWGLPSFIVHGTAALLRKAGARRASGILDKLPTGIPTALQAELEWLIHTELLELPFVQGEQVFRRDALMEAVLNRPEISKLCEQYLEQIRNKSDRPEFRQRLESNLAEYAKTRMAVTELAGSLICLATSYATFNKAMPGALSTGMAAATAIAQHAAIANFWLGLTSGPVLQPFPASASTGLVIATTGTMMVAISRLCLPGRLTPARDWHTREPQLLYRRHRRRASRYGAPPDYRARDRYVARIFDLLILRAAARRWSQSAL